MATARASYRHLLTASPAAHGTLLFWNKAAAEK